MNKFSKFCIFFLAFYFGLIFNKRRSSRECSKIEIPIENTGNLVAIVTGSTSGLGIETAQHLLNYGVGTVYVTGRDSTQVEQAVKKLAQKHEYQNVISSELNLSSLKSVLKFVQTFNEKHSTLDILINNGGITGGEYQGTQDGFELQIGTNHLSHYLLTRLLLPNLNRSQHPGRIIHVSSQAASRGQINLHEWIYPMMMLGEEIPPPMKFYANSKLAQVHFSNELARKLKMNGSRVTSNVVHPGQIVTEAGRYVIPKFLHFLIPLGRLLLSGTVLNSFQQGVATQMALALSPSLSTVSGSFLYQCKPFPAPHTSFVKSDMDLLVWKASQVAVDPKEIMISSNGLELKENSTWISYEPPITTTNGFIDLMKIENAADLNTLPSSSSDKKNECDCKLEVAEVRYESTRNCSKRIEQEQAEKMHELKLLKDNFELQCNTKIASALDERQNEVKTSCASTGQEEEILQALKIEMSEMKRKYEIEKAKVTEMEDSLKTKDDLQSVIESLQREIQSNAQLLVSKDVAISNKDSLITQLNSQIEQNNQKDLEIVAKHEEISTKAKFIDELEAKTKHQDEKISDLENRIKELEPLTSKLHHSSVIEEELKFLKEQLQIAVDEAKSLKWSKRIGDQLSEQKYNRLHEECVAELDEASVQYKSKALELHRAIGQIKKTKEALSSCTIQMEETRERIAEETAEKGREESDEEQNKVREEFERYTRNKLSETSERIQHLDM